MTDLSDRQHDACKAQENAFIADRLSDAATIPAKRCPEKLWVVLEAAYRSGKQIVTMSAVREV
jgi:hypothetical protein